MRFQLSNRHLAAALISILMPICLSAQPLDEAYHNNAEIIAELRQLARQYPDWMSLDSIGHSAEDSLPIWCVKLSDNSDQIEPEAALLFIGQVHAEEVVGVELALQIMKEMLENNDNNLMRQRLEGLEIYIIPTANPEGLEVVHSGRDVTFRKNKRDNVGDGQLRIYDGEGWDTSGVDLNRNFGMHWDRGDTLYRPEQNFRYNGYRGSAPFSEPESRAIRDLALSRPFLYSIVYHSSRSGTNAELLIGPWYWAQNGVIKRPPDAPAINALGETLADLMPVQNFDSTYWYGQSTQRKGQLQDWFYVETGCIQYMAEIGEDIHPDSAGMREIVTDQLTAVWYLMDLALGLEGLDGFGTLTVMAADAETGEPLEAIVEIDEGTHPILTPRKTNLEIGRFDWLLETGEHPLDIKKLGYETQSWGNYRIPDGERTVLEVRLEPVRPVRYTFNLRESSGEPFWAGVNLVDMDGRGSLGFSFDQNGLTIELPPARYKLILGGRSGHHSLLPRSFPIEIARDDTLELTLPKAGFIFWETFERDLGWRRGGNGGDWGIEPADGRDFNGSLTESIHGDYSNDADSWIQLDSICSLDRAHLASIQIRHQPYFEPGVDYGEISWWTNPEEVRSARYSKLRTTYHDDYFDLDDLEPGPLQVKFRVVSDEAIGEDGWRIGDVFIWMEGYQDAPAEPPLTPCTLNLAHPYPNPFNSTVSIFFSVGAQGLAPLRLGIYDLQGRLAADLIDKRGRLSYAAGVHKVVWDATDQMSGIYFVRLQTDNRTSTRKIILIR